jgi:hypothetical protein
MDRFVIRKRKVSNLKIIQLSRSVVVGVVIHLNPDDAEDEEDEEAEEEDVTQHG